MICDMDITRSLGAQRCAPSKRRDFITFSQS